MHAAIFAASGYGAVKWQPAKSASRGHPPPASGHDRAAALFGNRIAGARGGDFGCRSTDISSAWRCS
jgi:hypothetical protein